MSDKLPPAPVGAPVGSSLMNDWYEKLRTLFNSGLISILWANIDFSGSNITDIVSRAHNNLQGIQGGAAGDYQHLTTAQVAKVNSIPVGGISGTVTTAKLTLAGANGSMTFVNGVLTAAVQAT